MKLVEQGSGLCLAVDPTFVGRPCPRFLLDAVRRADKLERFAVCLAGQWFYTRRSTTSAPWHSRKTGSPLDRGDPHKTSRPWDSRNPAEVSLSFGAFAQQFPCFGSLSSASSRVNSICFRVIGLPTTVPSFPAVLALCVRQCRFRDADFARHLRRGSCLRSRLAEQRPA
jgi:hypothetical protein